MRSPVTRRLAAGVAMLLAVTAQARAADAPLPASAGDWLTNGRTDHEERYAPLDQIDQKTVGRIGLAWEADLESPRFGIEATPIVVDGILYVTSSWGRVFAFEARTGKRLWAFDPQAQGEWLRNGCCKPVNRGVAVWKGKVYVGAFDGRLIALDAANGRKIWETSTTNGDRFYTITGAPHVVKGKVIIGNGGADFGVRGFFSAYDAETGALAWRFYVVPGDPKKGFEHPELALAAKTWNPNRDWSIGGGGNPWDSFAYDPELDLLYVGTGNASPDDPKAPSPAREDKLFVASILAIHADSGKMAWHYQTTPGDAWDFDATQNMILSDLTIGGSQRKVLMQASKNGFFYVIDRATGQLLSANKYVRVNWASGVDLQTGRPIVTGQGDYAKGTRLVFPSPYGGHNWMPMSFSPKTGLVYVPARDIGWVWGADQPTWFYSGYDLSKLTDADVRKQTRGELIAWDPVAGKPAWTVPQKTLSNGGTLATAGGLVVQGTEDGTIGFYAADTGRLLHRILIGTGIVAPPISYQLDGIQYITVAAGWNGVKTEAPAPGAPAPYSNAGRLIVLKLDGGKVPVAPRAPLADFLADDTKQPAESVAAGGKLYQAHCAVCHGSFGEGGVFPDLRRISQDTSDGFAEIVLGGALKAGGMASFADVLDAHGVDAIHAYIVDWAQRSRRGLKGGPAQGDGKAAPGSRSLGL